MYDHLAEERLSSYQDVEFLPDRVTLNIEYDQEQSDPTKSNSIGCELCGIKVTSLNVLKRHFEGRRHLMRVERQGKTFECDLCQISANSQTQLDAHLKSSKHRNRLFKKEHGHEISNKGIWIILFFVACIFLNLLLVFKIML